MSRALVGTAATTTVEATFERLADVVDAVLDQQLLDHLAGVGDAMIAPHRRSRRDA